MGSWEGQTSELSTTLGRWPRRMQPLVRQFEYVPYMRAALTFGKDGTDRLTDRHQIVVLPLSDRRGQRK